MKGNILYIVHQWIDTSNYDSTSIGGTTLHILDIVNEIKDEYNCFVLYHANGLYNLAVYQNGSVNFFDLGFHVKSNLFDCYDEDYEKMLLELIVKLKIDFVHIHHLLGHAYNILNVLKLRKIRTIITLHDYFLICPRVNMLYKNQDYCSLTSISCCEECFDNKFDFKTRNMIVGDLFNYADTIIVPNKTVERIYKKIYSDIDCKLIEHGSDLIQVNPVNSNNKRLNVAFVGWLTYLKGSDIAKIVIQNSNPKEYLFHLFGLSDDPFFNQNTKNYQYHGEYKRENLAHLLRKNKIDVVCLLTRCPESFCYTLSEVLCAGIPVIGFDIGAIGERIKRLNVGWTVSLESKEIGVLNKLNEIRAKPAMYQKCLKSFSKLKLPTTEHMVNQTLKEYKVLITGNKGDKEWSLEQLNNISFKITEIKVVKKKIKGNNIISILKRRIPYSIKRPVYLAVQKLRGGKK